MTAWRDPTYKGKPHADEFRNYYMDLEGRQWLYWRPDGLFELFGRNLDGRPTIQGVYRSSSNDDDPLDLDTGLVFLTSRNEAFLLTKVTDETRQS